MVARLKTLAVLIQIFENVASGTSITTDWGPQTPKQTILHLIKIKVTKGLKPNQLLEPTYPRVARTCPTNEIDAYSDGQHNSCFADKLFTHTSTHLTLTLPIKLFTLPVNSLLTLLVDVGVHADVGANGGVGDRRHGRQQTGSPHHPRLAPEPVPHQLHHLEHQPNLRQNTHIQHVWLSNAGDTLDQRPLVHYHCSAKSGQKSSEH